MQPVPQTTLHFCRISCRSDFQYTHTQITCSILIFFKSVTLHIDMLYLFFNLQAWGFGDQSSGATQNKVVRVGTIYGCWGVGGGCLVVIQEILSLIQKEKDINCNVLLSIQSMDKRPRMNVLQTPGFQYCVYFDGLSPALCNFRGLCVWLVSCDCALSL